MATTSKPPLLLPPLVSRLVQNKRFRFGVQYDARQWVVTLTSLPKLEQALELGLAHKLEKRGRSLDAALLKLDEALRNKEAWRL
jgi:hypothetical protein